MGAKDRVRQMLGKVTPGQPLTRQPGPRVLIKDPGMHVGRLMHGQQGGYIRGPYDANELAERLRATVPTVEVADRLSDFNLNEWDCLVTDAAPATLDTRHAPQQTRYDAPTPLHSWSQRYPETLSVICVLKPGDLQILDALPPEGEDRPDLPDVVIVRDPDTVGGHIRGVDGLPDLIASVVAQELLPVARNRQAHMSFRRWPHEDHEGKQGEQETGPEYELSLRPFLLGPDDVVLAGSYERTDSASAWLLPYDVPDLYPWVVAALSEWHGLYPTRFPLLPDWHDSPLWQSATEADIARRREQLDESLRALVEQHQAQIASLDIEAEDARRNGDRYERALLTEDGDALAEAVACAFADLGFHVVDMDQHWPERDRREDLRIFDDQDPDWVAIVEVKGATGGAKETELHSFGRWAEFFIHEEGRMPSARWFVTNHQRRRDPSTRIEPFANKPALLRSFAQSNGTVIDTRALFDLLTIVQAEPTFADRARALLKGKPPVLVRVTVADLSAEQSDESGATS